MPIIYPGGVGTGHIIKPPNAGSIVTPPPQGSNRAYAFNDGIMFGNQAINGVQPITEANFIKLLAKGYDNIRLGLSPQLVFTDKTCTAWKSDAKAYIDGIYDLCKSYKFTLIVDNHPLVYNVDQSITNTNNDNVNAAQLAISKQIMLMYIQAWPNDTNVYLEMLNEPDTRLFTSATAWKNFHEPLAQYIRANDPLGNARKILADGQYQAYPSGFNNLTPIKRADGSVDTNIIPTIHVYNPFSMTHCGVSWIPTYTNFSGIRYLAGNPDNIGTDPAYIDNQFTSHGFSSVSSDERTVVYNKAKIDDIVSDAVNWCATYGLKLHMGEFGVYTGQQANYPLDSLAYMADIVRICRKSNIAYNMFAFQSNFPITDAMMDLVKTITDYNSPVPALVAGSTFNLATLPNLAEWLTTRTASSVQHIGATATNNQTVSQWNSLNGTYNYTMNDADANRPVLVNNVQGGQPVVRFTPSTMLSGNSDVLNVSANVSGLTMILAGGWRDYNAGTDINVIFQEFVNGYNNQRTILFASKSADPKTSFQYMGAKNVDSNVGGNGQFNSVEYVPVGFAIWTFRIDFSTATGSLRRNGVYVIPDGTPIPGMTAGNTPNTPSLLTQIGQAAASNSEGSNYDLGELIRCKAALPLATIQQAENQLATYFGVDFNYNPVLKTPSAFTMTFEDTFTASTVDTAKWIYTFEDGRDTTPTNNEQQVYKPAQATIASGILDLKCEKVNTVAYTGGTLPYRSGMICSASKFTQKYGYFEARVKTPPGRGVWPAFWLLKQSPYREIDIFEQFGEADRIYGTVYYQSGSTYPSKNGFFRNGINITADYHKYAVDWTADYIRWYFDDYMYSEVKASDFPAYIPDIPLYMLLNLAIDGNNPPDSGTVFPADYLVDYVRAWQRV